MNRSAQESRPSGMMIGIFLAILISYLIYLMILSPWERKALLTQEATMTVNVVDCKSEYPISGARVQFYTQEGVLIKEATTGENGVAAHKDLPDCFRIKASFSTDLYENICVGSGEERIINLCFDYPEANPRVLFYEQEVGLIGGTNGETISTKEFSNAILSYPLSTAIVNHPSQFLYSNLLWSEGFGINLTNIDESITKSINFEFTLQSKRGDPKIKVYSNNQLVYDSKTLEGEIVNINIPKTTINKTINIQIKCDFTGIFFWTTQDCNLTDIKAIQEFYTPKKVNQTYEFSTTINERRAENVELSFVSTDQTQSGIKATINDYEVFNSNSLLSKAYNASIDTAMINLNDTGNKLVLEANPGAEAWLRAIYLKFTTAIMPKESESYIFRITDSALNSINKAFANIYISDVYLNGAINIKVNDVTYTQIIDKAGWNTIELDPEDLLNTNELEISSLKGRFGIEELKITYE